MTNRATSIPIEHCRAAHDIDAQADSPMPQLTLLELVEAVRSVCDTDEEMLATVRYMLDSGRVRLAKPKRTASVPPPPVVPLT